MADHCFTTKPIFSNPQKIPLPSKDNLYKNPLFTVTFSFQTSLVFASCIITFFFQKSSFSALIQTPFQPAQVCNNLSVLIERGEAKKNYCSVCFTVQLGLSYIFSHSKVACGVHQKIIDRYNETFSANHDDVPRVEFCPSTAEIYTFSGVINHVE